MVEQNSYYFLINLIQHILNIIRYSINLLLIENTFDYNYLSRGIFNYLYKYYVINVCVCIVV